MSRYKGSHKLTTLTLHGVEFELRHARHPDGSKAPGFIDMTYKGKPVLYEVNWFAGKDLEQAKEFFQDNCPKYTEDELQKRLKIALKNVPQ